MGGSTSVGSIIGGIAGAVIGSYWGMGYQGFMIGSALGGVISGWLDPPDAPKPPLLGNLGANTYVHSAPVPILYGICKVYGGCIWLGDVVADTENNGSSKDPEYSYETDMWFAIAHCEGPVVEILQYWIDDKLYEAYGQDGFYAVFTQYLGTGTQAIDPDIGDQQDGVSIGAYPYRWTCYTSIHLHIKNAVASVIPSISAEVNGFLTETDEYDANPIRVVYDFLTSQRYGCGMSASRFDGSPTDAGSSWKIASDYCDESVSYTDGDEQTTVSEPRFRYSNAIDARTKGYDIVNEILSTCRCMLKEVDGKLTVAIENGLEVPTHYYSDRVELEITSGMGHSASRIYADFSDYPDDYLNDASIFIDDPAVSGSVVGNAVLDQTSTYIDLCDSLSFVPGDGIVVSIVKDNIKKSSFSFRKVDPNSVYDKVRVEFINRTSMNQQDEEIVSYQWDVVEYEYPDVYCYGTTFYGHTEVFNLREKTVRLAGIKRKSQAIRMAQFLCLFSRHCQWFCEFTTDMVGFQHSIGDVIGISHGIAGWDKKYFRVVSMEESDLEEVKLTCLEYSNKPLVDDIDTVYRTRLNIIKSPYAEIGVVERLHAVFDYGDNGGYKVMVFYKIPDNEPWFYGAQVWIQRDGSDYEYILTSGNSSPSVKLASNIDDDDTVISFDPDTLYLTFDSFGEFYLGDERISYSSIDSMNNQFLDCVRGKNNTTPVAHTLDEYCHFRKTEKQINLDYNGSDYGTTWTVKLISMSTASIESDFSTSPTVDVLLEQPLEPPIEP